MNLNWPTGREGMRAFSFTDYISRVHFEGPNFVISIKALMLDKCRIVQEEDLQFLSPEGK